MNSKNPSPQNIVCADDVQSLDTRNTAESNGQFGDGFCGEPLIAQHLVIDFTPRDEDNEYNQKKCCAFWDFIKSFPELQSLMVLPEPIIHNASTSMPSSSSTTLESSSSVVKSTEHDQSVDRTAVSMLGFAEEKGLINRIFEAKLPKSTCSLGLREYVVEDSRSKKVSLPKTESEVRAVVPIRAGCLRVLSIFCCSCLQAMPTTRSSSGTTASYLKASSVTLDTGRSKEQLTADISPAAGDTHRTEVGDKEFSAMAELEGVVIELDKKEEPKTKDRTIVPVHNKTNVTKQKS